MHNFLTKELQHINIAQEILNAGYPALYKGNKGRFIKEYPDGKKFLLGCSHLYPNNSFFSF